MKRYRRKLLQYYHGLCREFHALFLDVVEHYGKETIHDLRVNMKKQRAFFRFLEAADASFSARDAKAVYGELYHLAGQVRDLQVERALLKERTRVKPYFLKMLRRREREYLQLLQDYELELTLAPVRELERKVEFHVLCLLAGPLFDGLEAYFVRLQGKIRSILEDGEWWEVNGEREHMEGGTGNEEGMQGEKQVSGRLHELRKRLKELYYNVGMLEMLHPEVKCSRKRMKRLEVFQTVLGDWHDLDFIRTILQTESGIVGAKAQKKIEKEWRQSTENAIRKLHKLPKLSAPLRNEIDAMLRSARNTVLEENAATPSVEQESIEPLNVEEGIK